jgi:outer membrane lipoprotein SlyB
MFKRLLFIATLLLAGCASGPESIGSRSADKPKDVVQLGVIEAVTPIELDNSSYAGANVGGVFGQVGGASGGGRGGVVGSILGGVLGSTLGQQAGIATQPGLEIWVKLDESGKSAYVMQPDKPDAFKVGDRVRIVRKNGGARVEPIPAGEPAPATAPAPANGTSPPQPK